MSQAFEDAKEDIIDCVFKFIDRMNDVCEQDTADRIVNEYIEKMNPLIWEYLEIKQSRETWLRQTSLEFRSPEEIAAWEAERAKRIRPLSSLREEGFIKRALDRRNGKRDE